MEDPYLTHLSDQAGAAVKEVEADFANVAREIRSEIAAGRLNRDEAISRLTGKYRLTKRGAVDILDNA